MKHSLTRYIAALLLFGTSGILASSIKLSSDQIVMFRTMIGSLLLIILYLVTNRKFYFYQHLHSFAYLLLSGISMGVSWLFLYEAYQSVWISIASLGYYCGPILVMAISPVLFQEHFSKKKLLCFLVVFAGILLVNGRIATVSRNSFGIFCALMSALMYPCMVTFNKKAEDIKGMENPTLQLTIAFISVFVWVVSRQGLHIHLAQTDVLPLVFLGLVNTGLGCFLCFSSIGEIPVQTVAILGYLEPLSAVVFSVLFLQERLSILQWGGAVCMFFGAMLAELRPRHPNS